MTDKALNYLGIAKKAGKIVLGFTGCAAAADQGRVKLFLLPSDAADKSFSRVRKMMQGHRALCLQLPYSGEQLGGIFGSGACAAAAVTDIGLAAAAAQALSEDNPRNGDYENAAAVLRQRRDKAARRKAAGPHRKQGGSQV